MAPIITRALSHESIAEYRFAKPQIPLGEYLFLRIIQANPKIRSIFGIPGDFNLALLEHLYADSVGEKVEFVGFCNELNAAYAADGYAKIIESLSVLITTFGVGELSALNGIAGAFAEYAPVLHIVGTSSTRQISQAKHAKNENVENIHHLVQNKNALAPPNHDVYKSVVENFSVVQESLDSDMLLNLERIDNVLTTVLHERRPGYLFIPSDISDVLVPTSRLQEPLAIEEPANAALLAEMSVRILAKLYGSKNPSVIGDALADRFGAQEALDSFVAKLPANFVKLFTTPMGRNIDEDLPNFVGVYSGNMSSGPEVVESLEKNSDFLLTLGYANNEINAGAYSTNFDHIQDYVEVHPDYISIDGEYVHTKDPETGKRSFSIVDLIDKLASSFQASKLVYNDNIVNNIKARRQIRSFASDDTGPTEMITQNKLTDFFNAYLKPNDVLVVETCSFLFGISDLKFPKGVSFFSQNFYGSIGYALPATFGVSRAIKDLDTNRRVLLIQGDGSAQMTIQELSTYLRYEIQSPEIFLLNNEGYTVERVIKGPTRSYNDIQDNWEWTDFFKIFGDKACEKHQAEKVNTTSELEGLIGRKTSSKICLYELKLGKLDIPQRFKTFLAKK
ncbi:hypothetical protein OXX80_004323 [Metschnikowia pulcherrima]